MKRITIKNVHFSEALSEETNAYTADVYLDNKKFGYAKNSGHGGETFIQAYPDKRDMLKEATQYATGLNPIEFGKFSMPATLDIVVDYLLEKHLEAKDLKRIMNKGLIFKDKDGVTQIIKWNVPLKKVLEHPQGIGMVKAKILGVLNEGGEVLNQNLPQELLNLK